MYSLVGDRVPSSTDVVFDPDSGPAIEPDTVRECATEKSIALLLEVASELEDDFAEVTIHKQGLGFEVVVACGRTLEYGATDSTLYAAVKSVMGNVREEAIRRIDDNMTSMELGAVIERNRLCALVERIP